jgi:hypothetical protein
MLDNEEQINALEEPFKHVLQTRRSSAGCIEINLLFDALAHEKNMREKEIFDLYFAQKSAATLSAFLRDVKTCPDEIIAFCQEILAPKPQ